MALEREGHGGHPAVHGLAEVMPRMVRPLKLRRPSISFSVILCSYCTMTSHAEAMRLARVAPEPNCSRYSMAPSVPAMPSWLSVPVSNLCGRSSRRGAPCSRRFPSGSALGPTGSPGADRNHL